MLSNHILNINDKEINKINVYSDKCLEYIIRQKEIEPFEKFNPRNKKSVIIYDN